VRGLLSLQTAVRRRDLPTEENDLVPLATLQLVFKVVNSPSALSLWEISEEIVVVAGVARLLDDNLVIVFVEVVDDILVLVTKFEILVLGETFAVGTDARCLWIRVRKSMIGLERVKMEACHG